MATTFDMVKELGKENGGMKIIGVFPQEEPKNGTFHAVAKMECPNCGGNMRVDGYFATGEELPSGYTPSKNELVKNNVMECKHCGDWQVS